MYITTTNPAQEYQIAFQNPLVILFTLIWCSIIIALLIVKRGAIKSFIHNFICEVKAGWEKDRKIKNARTPEERKRYHKLTILTIAFIGLLFCVFILGLAFTSLNPSTVNVIIFMELFTLCFIPIGLGSVALMKIDLAVEKRLEL